MIVYVIQLFDDKYYVGRTNNLDRRIEEHKNGYGSEWTKKYQFIKLLKSINTNDLFIEDKYVKMYMNKYGINNVRGGSYSNIELNKEQENILKKELNTINNNCYRCGRNNHFIKNCYAKTNIDGNELTNKLTENKKNKEDLNLYQDIISNIKSIYRFFKY
jgi:cellular nucleic acid-binding protein